jgi:hypothetical protein
MATQLKTVEQTLDDIDAERRARNIAQRIAAVMGEVDYVQKEKKQGMNYSIVSHDAVTAKVRPLLHKHGVIYYPRNLQVQQVGNRTEAVFAVRFENIDDRTDFIDVETMGYGVDPQDKGPGKAISYGVKYALLKVLGLETGDDPDTVQDTRADYQPPANDPITTGEPKPKTTREKLEGPFSSESTLKAAIKAFATTLTNMSDLGEFSAWMETPDVVELEKQALRYLPEWWDTGEGMPAEFVPVAIRIEQRKRDLENIETTKTRENA